MYNSNFAILLTITLYCKHVLLLFDTSGCVQITEFYFVLCLPHVHAHIIHAHVISYCTLYYSYEQLTHIHPEIDDYKLYYAQVRMTNVTVQFKILEFIHMLLVYSVGIVQGVLLS